MLRTLMGHVEYLEGAIDELIARIKELARPFDDQIRRRARSPACSGAR